MSKSTKTPVQELKMNRFVIRKTLVGKNAVITFTNKQGETYKYSHDEVFNTHKDRFESMPCWDKYKGYTQTHKMPAFCRDLNQVVTTEK